MAEQRKIAATGESVRPPGVTSERAESLARRESDERLGHARDRCESPIFIVDDTCRVVYQTVRPAGTFRDFIADGDRLRADISAALFCCMRQADGAETVSISAFVEPALLMRLRRLQGAHESLFVVAFETFRNQDVIRVAVRRYGLTRREQEVLRWAFEGANAAEIGTALAISEHTVHVYLKRLLKKTNSRNRVAMVAHVLEWDAGASRGGRASSS